MTKSIFGVSNAFRDTKTRRWLGLLTFCMTLFMGQMSFAQSVATQTFSASGLDVNNPQIIITPSLITVNSGEPIQSVKILDFTYEDAYDYSDSFGDICNQVGADFWYAFNLSVTGGVAGGHSVIEGCNDDFENLNVTGFSNLTFTLVDTDDYASGDFVAFEVVLEVTYGVPPACPLPTALTAATTANSAILGWAGTGNFDIKWGISGFDVTTQGTLVSGANNPYNLPGLTTGTAYQFYVRKDCGSGVFSNWAGPISFTASSTATYTAGNIGTQFLGTPTSSSPTTCPGTLTVIVPEGKRIASLTTEYSMYATTSAQNGTASPAYMSEQKSYIYSPTLMAGESSVVSGAGSAAGTYNYTNRTLAFAAGATGTVTFELRAFRTWEGVSGCNSTVQYVVNGTWKLIPVFEDIPSCIEPLLSSLTATPSFNSAVLSWGGTGNFDISWGTGTFAAEAGTIVTGFNNGGTLSGLTANTTYGYYVRQNCGSGNLSVWSGPYSFYTGYCTPTGTSSSYRITGVSTTGGFTQNISNLTNGTTSPYNDYSSTHIVNQYPGGIINYTVNAASYTGVKIWVDLNQNLVFEESELVASHLTSNAGATWTGTITVPSDLPLGNYRMRIRSNYYTYTIPACGEAQFNYGEAEDYMLSVVTPPSCIQPTALTASNFTINSADLSWTSAGTDFDIKWGTTGFNFETEGTLIEDFANNGTLSGLTANTNYSYYVRTNCGEGDLSNWAGPFSFVTACDTPNAPTDMTFTSVTNTSTTVNYIAPAVAPTGYTIFRSTSNIAPVLANGTAYTVSQTTAVAALTTENGTYFCVANPTTLSGSASSLTANTQYYYYVYSRNCTGTATVYSVAPLTGTATTSPAAPTAFVSSDITFTTATVGWTAPAGGAGTYTYSVEVATDSGFTSQIAGSPFSASTNSYNLTNLAQGTFHYVRVTANNGFSNSTSLAGNITTLLPGQVGSGIATNSVVPIVSNYGYTYSQQIYTKAQVEANLEEGHNFITKIKFYYNGTSTTATPGTTSVATTTFNNWTVYLGNTEKTSFSTNTDWIAVANLEQSFSGTVTFPAAGNWMEITLDTPFQWDGNSNIAVAIDENSDSYGTLVYWRSFTSAANTGIYYRVDGVANNPNPASPPSATGRVAALAQVAFDAIETPECMPVSNVLVSDITPYTASISWMGEDDLYVLEYGLSGFTQGTGTLLQDTNNPTLLENLLPETAYHVYVRQMCGGNESPWAGPYTFTTGIACAAPATGTSTGVTAKSATLNWTSTGDTFIINWGTGTFAAGEGTNTETSVSGTSFTFPNNLNGTTTYRWFVRRDCSGTNDGLSAWSGPYTFTTLLVNDNFADALPVACGQTYTGSTATATNDQPNPAVFGVAATLSPNVWYSYTGTGTPELVTLSLCNSAFDTAILVGTGTAGNLNWIAGNEDFCGASNWRSQVDFNSDGTTTYWIMVRGFSVSATGAYELVVTCTAACTPATTNDECVTAEALTLGVAYETGNQCATSSDVNYPTCSGGTQYTSHFDSWYSFNSGDSGQVSVSISVETGTVGFAVYSGACATTMTSVSCMAPTSSSTSSIITVTPNTNYYVRAYSNSTETRGEFTLTVNTFCMLGEWTGATSTAWNTASNWCGSVVPTGASDVIISTNSNNRYPVISSAVTVNSITVASGASITINSNTFTTGNITVANGGDFVVKHNASLMQGSTAVNSGNVTVQKELSIKHLDYTIWSSPVTGTQTLKQFSPQTVDNRIRVYDGPGAGTWHTTNVNVPFTAGKGYMFRAPNVFDDGFYPNAYTWTGSFVGTPNNQDVTATFVANSAGYQAVGNPYPMSINGEDFHLLNENNIGTLYFWDTQRSEANRTGGAAWATWHPETGGVSAAGGAEPDGIIPSGQGFLVEVNNTATAVEFTTDMRTNTQGTFFRTINPERHRLWLNLSNQDMFFNQTLVAYLNGASQGVDTRLDAKMIDNSGTALYSIIDSQATEYIVQARALPFNDLDVVPMGFRAIEAGTYTISLANFDGLFTEGQEIFIKDNLTQATQNLKEDSYTFVSEAGTFETRFEVVYRLGSLSVTNPELNNNWVVYAKDGKFTIETAGFEMKQVVVYDMLGRTVYQSAAEGNLHNVAHINANQVLIVKVITTENAELTKKVSN